MAKGAKKQQLQSQTTTQAAPPSYAQPYVNDILSRAQNASYQPYQPYGGNRIAGFTDAEKTARTGIMGLTAPTQFNTATQMATNAGNYTPGKFTTNSFNDSGMASQYMSPYMQNVVDVQKQSAIRDAKQGQLAGNLGAARQGTYGGSRQLLANMERERNLGTQLGSIQATGSQAAYDAAQKQFGSEQDRRLQAQQYGEQSRQFGARQGLDAANQLSQLGSAQQSSDISRYGAMAGVGETERGLRQKGLDTAYDDFKNQRDYEKNQLRDYSDIVGAQPQGNMTESVYGQPANQTGALIGAAGNIGSAYMMHKMGGVGVGSGDVPINRSAGGGEIYSYNNGGLVALADGGGVDAGKQQGLAAIAGGNDGSKYKLKNDPKELLYSTMGDPAKLQALAQQGADLTAIGIAAMLAKRIYDTQSMAMAPQQTTVAGLLNPQPQQPQGQQGQPQGQQGLAGIAPQGQPPMDPMQGQPPMDPMQAQGLEALAQQDQPMEEQPMEEPMMAANGGLMNINLPDDYYDEDSYSHGGIAHFAEGSPGVMDYAGDVANWVKENPVEAGAYGLGALAIAATSEVAIPATIIGRLASALPALAKKVGPKVFNAMKGLVSKQVLARKVPANFISPALETVFSPGRTAATLYGAKKVGDYFSTPPGFEEAGRDLVAPTNSGLRDYLEEQDLSALPARREGPTEQEKIMKQLYAEMGKRYEPSGGSPQAQEPEFDYDAMKIKNRKELENKYGAPSPEEEAYLADLKKQKPLEDTSKQDFYRTTGDFFKGLTEGSLEGKSLLEAAAGATSVLPGSVARSIGNKKAREEKAEADNRSRLSELLNMQRSRRGDNIELDEQATSGTDSAYNRYIGERAAATTASNRAEDQEREDFAANKADTIKMLELQLKQVTGPEKSDLQEKIDLLRTDPALYMQMFGDKGGVTTQQINAYKAAIDNAPTDEARQFAIDEMMAAVNGGGQRYKEGDTGVTGDGRPAIYKNGRWEFSS